MDCREIDILIVADAPAALTYVCGISLLERTLRTLQRIGFRQATVLSTAEEPIRRHLAKPSWARENLAVSVHNDRARVLHELTYEHVLIVSGNGMLDRRLFAAVLEMRQPATLIDSAPPPGLLPLLPPALQTPSGWSCGASFVERRWLAALRSDEPLLQASAARGGVRLVDVAKQPTYLADMRRDLRPLWFPAPEAHNIRHAEALILNAAQNGTLDLPAIVHGPIETWIVARLCRTPVTPNEITLFTAAVSAIVTLLFATGHLAAGTMLALVVGVLDGLDGKQARVKVETTALGKREHVLDFILELSWWTALAYHFTRTAEIGKAFSFLSLLLVADLIGRAAKKRVKQTTARNLDDVAPIDRFVRLIGARRNIYVWLLAAGLLLGAADKAFVVLCWWSAVTAVIHVLRAGWISRQARVAMPKSISH